jgi:hypothetical protein
MWEMISEYFPFTYSFLSLDDLWGPEKLSRGAARTDYLYCNVLGVLFMMELYCSPKGQYTTVKHRQKLFEHT